MKWIKCKDKMPEPQENGFAQNVLIYTTAWGMHVAAWTGKKWLIYHECCSYNGNPNGTVTHWMPLPEPPEVENGLHNG